MVNFKREETKFYVEYNSNLGKVSNKDWKEGQSWLALMLALAFFLL